MLGIGVAAQAGFSAAISGLPVTGTSMRGGYLLTTFILGVVIGATYLGTAVSEIAWCIWPDRSASTGAAGRPAHDGLALALMAIGLVPGGGGVPPT
ncbi:hypothetical protein AB0M48_12390 [Lentzea sp. NPDC051208]|uniref:hypothetical protein n=1 Tax=Lentzea sp. NPDC051208 TaxID=3154642 RepID=UPI0034210287